MSAINIYTATITLILVMDPLGNIPIFLSILKPFSQERQTKIILRESVFAFFLLNIFLFFGTHILDGLNITPAALNISGGIILFIIALGMIFPRLNVTVQEQLHDEPFFVPLATPLIAGPTTLAAVLLLPAQAPNSMLSWFFALCIASTITTLILLLARYLMQILSKRGIIALEKLMGMLLTSIAVQMLLTGVTAYMNH